MSSYKALFFGTPEFAVPILNLARELPFLELKAVVTQPDQPVGKKQVVTPPPIKLAAEKFNLTVLQPEKIKTKEFADTIHRLNPDVVMVVAYGKIIPANLLKLAKFGWLNVHASLLPKFRGASPIQAAILAGEGKTGVTLMKLDSGMDTGPIISQKEIEITPQENSQTLHDKLSRLGAELTQESLLPYLEGQLTPEKQDESLASDTKIIKKEDGRINWKKPGTLIERQIRAYTPWPGTYCFWSRRHGNGQKVMANPVIALRLKIIKAFVSKEKMQLPPGQTKKIDGKIIVGCGRGNLELTTVQLEGKKVQPINEFMLGYPEIEQTQLA